MPVDTFFKNFPIEHTPYFHWSAHVFPTLPAWSILKTNSDETNWWFPLCFNILCTISNGWCNIIQKFTWCSYFWCLKWLSLFPFSPHFKHSSGLLGLFHVCVCAHIDQRLCECCVCLCVHARAHVCVCVLKPTEGSQAHGSATWIFSFASGRCALPRYGESCNWGWGWWSGRGTLSNGLPRDLTPLSRDTWAPYIPACSLCQNAHFLRYSFSNLLTPNSNPHPIRLSRPTS